MFPTFEQNFSTTRKDTFRKPGKAVEISLRRRRLLWWRDESYSLDCLDAREGTVLFGEKKENEDENAKGQIAIFEN